MGNRQAEPTTGARFAHNLRVCRVSLGVSQEQLAALMDLSRTFVSDVERENRNCSVDNIERLAQALKIDVLELFAPVIDADIFPEPLPKDQYVIGQAIRNIG